MLKVNKRKTNYLWADWSTWLSLWKRQPSWCVPSVSLYCWRVFYTPGFWHNPIERNPKVLNLVNVGAMVLDHRVQSNGLGTARSKMPWHRVPSAAGHRLVGRLYLAAAHLLVGIQTLQACLKSSPVWLLVLWKWMARLLCHKKPRASKGTSKWVLHNRLGRLQVTYTKFV